MANLDLSMYNLLDIDNAIKNVLRVLILCTNNYKYIIWTLNFIDRHHSARRINFVLYPVLTTKNMFHGLSLPSLKNTKISLKMFFGYTANDNYLLS